MVGQPVTTFNDVRNGFACTEGDSIGNSTRRIDQSIFDHGNSAASFTKLLQQVKIFAGHAATVVTARFLIRLFGADDGRADGKV